MRIIDRHISQSMIAIFLTSVSIFCFLYILIDVTSNLDEILGRKVPIPILLKYYLSFFPIILVQTSSIACLISVLFTFSRMNNNNEIIALRASGLNFWQITKPAIMFGLLISALVFWMNERFVPQATASSTQIRNENIILEADRLKGKKVAIKNLTFYGLKNRLYFIDSFNPNTYECEGVTIVTHDEHQNVREKIVAFKGIWTGIAWKFFKCQITLFDPTDVRTPLKIKVYEEKLMDIGETPEDFYNQRLEVSSMNFKQLQEYIARFQNSGAIKAINNLRVDLYQKIAYPMGNFVIVLLGLAFALMMKSRKGTTFTSLGIAVAIGFLYYVVNAVAIAFGKGGLLPPILSAWSTPLLFTAGAWAMIKSYF